MSLVISRPDGWCCRAADREVRHDRRDVARRGSFRGWTRLSRGRRQDGDAGLAGDAGNLGFFVPQRPVGDRAEILTMSLWTSMGAVEAFAGPDPSKAVFLPEDDAWLVERDLPADDWDVVGEAD
jgi:hypothetical protein